MATALKPVTATAISAEELTASITEVSRQIVHSAKLAGDVVHLITDTKDKMRAMSGVAEKTSEVLDLVRGVASQTNLLATRPPVGRAPPRGRHLPHLDPRRLRTSGEHSFASRSLCGSGKALAIVGGLGSPRLCGKVGAAGVDTQAQVFLLTNPAKGARRGGRGDTHLVSR
jgi:hypothetical protein